MRLIQSRIEFRMGLGSSVIRMIREFDIFYELAIRRHSAQEHSMVLKDGMIDWIDFVSMAMSFFDAILAIELADPASWL